MCETTKLRGEQRLHYHWPVWFAEDFEQMLSQGQMADLGSSSAAFTCSADKHLYPGQSITARFSVPVYGENESFDVECYVRTGTICRVDQINPCILRITMQFAEALPFKPGKQRESKSVSEEILAFTES